MSNNNHLLTALLIQMLGWSYPILAKGNFRLDKPIVLIVGSEISRFAKELSISETKLFSCNDSKSQFFKELTTTETEIIFYYYSGGYKDGTMLEKLKIAIKTNTANGRNLTAIPMILAEGIIPKDKLLDAVYIELDGVSDCTMDFNNSNLDKAALDNAYKEVKAHLEDCEGTVALIRAASYLLHAFLNTNGGTETFEHIQNFVDLLLDKSEQSNDLNGLADIFIDHLYGYLSTNDYRLVSLPEIETDVLRGEKLTIFYDSEHVFFRSKDFEKIVHSMNYSVGIRTLKAALKNDGVLYTYTAKGYTVKVKTYNQYGVYARTEMLGFYQEQLDKVGQESFINIFMEDNYDY